MPITTTTAGTYDALLTSTLDVYAEHNLIDAIFDDLVFFYVLTGRHQRGYKEGNRGVRKNVKMQEGGESISFPILYAANSTADSYDGWDTLDVTEQNGITKGQATWKQLAVGIAISGRQERMNMGKSAILNLLEAKIHQAEMSIADEFSTELWSDGTGNASKDLTGTQAIVSATPTTGTLFGINRATYTWFRNQQRTGASFAAQGIQDMRIMFNSCTRGQRKPQLICTTVAIHEFYEDNLEPQMRYTHNALADAGFINLDFKGVPVVFDRDAPSGNIYFFNFDFLYMVVHPDAWFKTTPFMRPPQQDGKVAQILFMGNLVCTNPRFQGVITSVTA